MTDSTDDTPPDLTTAEIAEATDLHINTVRADIKSGLLPARRVAGDYVVPVDVATSYIFHRQAITAHRAQLKALAERSQEKEIDHDE